MRFGQKMKEKKKLQILQIEFDTKYEISNDSNQHILCENITLINFNEIIREISYNPKPKNQKQNKIE